MNIKAGCFISLLLFGPALARAEDSAPSPVLTDAQWRDLLSHLTSDKFADREAAQKQLDTFTWHNLDELKTRASTVADPEAASRLVARLNGLEDLRAYDPPAISVDFKDAALNEVIAALEKATGESLGNALSVRRPERFTLSAHEKPFWEIYRDLHQQHPLTVRTLLGQFNILPIASGMEPHRIYGGMAIFAGPITRGAPGNAGRIAASPQVPGYLFNYSVAVDPRIKVVKSYAPRLLRVIDDAGNTLFNAPQENVSSPAPGNPNNAANVQTGRQTLPIPEKPGKAIASATGELRLVLQLAATSVELAEADIKLNEPIAVGNEKITIRQFGDDGNSFRLQVSRATGRGEKDPMPVSVILLDANNRPLFGNVILGGFSSSISAKAAPTPFKLRLSSPTKTREVTIPFEFKDLPLP